VLASLPCQRHLDRHSNSTHTTPRVLSSPLARQVLDGYGAEYRVVELNEVQDGYALRAELADLTGRTSVPAVFIGGEFVGGCNDGGLGGVMTLDKAGKLQPMLQN
jgi:glutaredoxin 3